MNAHRTKAGLGRLFAGVVGLAMILASCGAVAAQQDAQPEEVPAVTVNVLRLRPELLQNYILVNGEIRPESTVEAYADTAGSLLSLKVRRGDRVQQGDIIAEVDPSRPGQRFAASPVRAPISGTVVNILPRVGGQVLPQTPIASIATIDRLEIVSQVPERRIANLSVGSRALVFLDSFPNQDFPARISLLSPTVDPQSRSLEIILSFDRRDTRIRPGMFAQVRIITGQQADALVVPQNAVQRRDGQAFVYVADDQDIARRREVVVGIEIDGRAQLLSGVRAGDRVIVRGQNLVQEGSLLRVNEEL